MRSLRFALGGATTLLLAANAPLLAQQMPLMAKPGLDGARLYRDYACNSCHGERGRDGLPGHPLLAGQDAGYLLEQLLAFKTRQRINGMAQTMTGTVANITADELTAIALYLAAQGCK